MARDATSPYTDGMFAGIPIIGLAGGIGSGKSFVARLFGELGCAVIDSDAQVRAAYRDPTVLRSLRQWWGDEVVDASGGVNKSAVARKIFNDPAERRRLEGMLHPIVRAARDAEMQAAVERAKSGAATQPLAFVWDTPLLFEAGLREECDAVVFIGTPRELRLQRVRQARGWGDEELTRRENLQWPLDKKRQLSDDRVTNTTEATADAGELLDQVRQALSRILTRLSRGPGL